MKTQTLKDLRKAAGLTQQELATHAELSISHYNLLERGIRNTPRARTMRRLAMALRCPYEVVRQAMINNNSDDPMAA